MIFVPGAFLILRLPSFIRVLIDFVQQFNGDEEACMGFLSFLQSVGDPSQGFINGVANLISRKARDALVASVCCGLYGRKRRRSKNSDNNDSSDGTGTDDDLETPLTDKHGGSFGLLEE